MYSLKDEYIKVYTPNHLGWEIGCGRKKKDLGIHQQRQMILQALFLKWV